MAYEFILSGYGFSNMDLSGVDFSGSYFERCDFRGANLDGCNFSSAYFYGCKFDDLNAFYPFFRSHRTRCVMNNCKVGKECDDGRHV